MDRYPHLSLYFDVSNGEAWWKEVLCPRDENSSFRIVATFPYDPEIPESRLAAIGKATDKSRSLNRQATRKRRW